MTHCIYIPVIIPTTTKIISEIPNIVIIIAGQIHIGKVTNHQDQVITPASFSTKKRTNITNNSPEPPLISFFLIIYL